MVDTLVERTVFETSDSGLACQWLEQAYQQAPHLRVVGDRPSGPLVHVTQNLAAGISSAEIAMIPPCEVRVDPSDLVTVDVLHGGTFEMYEDDHTVRRFADGDVLIASGPRRAYQCRTDDFHSQTATLPRPLLESVAGRPLDGPAVPWRFLDPVPADGAAAVLWRDTSAHVARLLADPDAADSELLLGNAARLLAAAALHAFPNTLHPGEPLPADRPGAVPGSVRHATAYIDDNAHRDITLADIAEHVHLTPRAVQYAFRRHLDTTPLAYLRRVRLEAAHRDLLAADPRTTTVTEIATRWGFGHHFSDLYRDTYRTPPGTTLHRPA